MPMDLEGGQPRWRRFKLYRYRVPDVLLRSFLKPVNIDSASRSVRSAKPMERLERRVMMCGSSGPHDGIGY